ncbi:hypothetical protein RLEG3_04945 (plasmid) [Rhizobium leguminosarum bv. trifolii WSM1689]|jgi:hypothetical protein|nr:hypothetical protein RLEG3_04945 [Rhizobium leguminosarum bv. trifolii WSM1689]
MKDWSLVAIRARRRRELLGIDRMQFPADLAALLRNESAMIPLATASTPEVR